MILLHDLFLIKATLLHALLCIAVYRNYERKEAYKKNDVEAHAHQMLYAIIMIG